MSLCQDTGHARVTTSSFYTKKTTVVTHTHTHALCVHYSVWLNIGRYCSGGILNVKTPYPLLKYTSVHYSHTSARNRSEHILCKTGFTTNTHSVYLYTGALAPMSLLWRVWGFSWEGGIRGADVNVRSCFFCLRWAQRSPRPYLKWSSLNVKWVSTMPVVFTRVRSTSCWVGMYSALAILSRSFR